MLLSLNRNYGAIKSRQLCKLFLVLVTVHSSLPGKAGTSHSGQFIPLNQSRGIYLYLRYTYSTRENQYFSAEVVCFGLHHQSKAVQQLILLSDLREAASSHDWLQVAGSQILITSKCCNLAQGLLLVIIWEYSVLTSPSLWTPLLLSKTNLT